MFSNSKVDVLESKLSMYEDLSREMLAKLESAVEKISEGNNRIAQILTKHDERIEQSMKTDSLIIKMIDELREQGEKNHQILHDRIDRIQKKVDANQKFVIGAGAVLATFALIAQVAFPVYNTLTTTARPVSMDTIDVNLPYDVS